MLHYTHDRVYFVSVDYIYLRGGSTETFFETSNYRSPLKQRLSTPTCIRTKYQGARDLRAVKISALYDLWRTKKRPKTETPKNQNFERPSTPQKLVVQTSIFGNTRFRLSPTFDVSTSDNFFFWIFPVSEIRFSFMWSYDSYDHMTI